MLVGSILSFGEFGFTGGVIASVGALALVILMLYLELVVLPKTALGRKMVVHGSGTKPSSKSVRLHLVMTTWGIFRMSIFWGLSFSMIDLYSKTIFSRNDVC